MALLLLFAGVMQAQAQQIDALKDIRAIDTVLQAKTHDPYARDYMYKNEHSLLKKLNPLHVIFGGALYVYQNVLSKHLSADCLYAPSCSEYGKQAVRQYGLLKGMVMTADRLNRCNRIAATDLRRYSPDPITHRYPDPVTRYK